jgi:putative transcriptional regulator
MISLKELRKAMGYTQVQLAIALGVSFATVNRWENGRTKPSRLAMLRIEEIRKGVCTIYDEEEIQWERKN